MLFLGGRFNKNGRFFSKGTTQQKGTIHGEAPRTDLSKSGLELAAHGLATAAEDMGWPKLERRASSKLAHDWPKLQRHSWPKPHMIALDLRREVREKIHKRAE